MSLATTTGMASAPSSKWQTFSSLFAPSVKAHFPLFALLFLYYAFAIVLGIATSTDTLPSLIALTLSFAGFILVLMPLSLATLRFYHLVRHVRPKHPIPALLKDMWQYVSEPRRAANGTVIVLVFVCFMSLFSNLKGLIPKIQPFSWDVTFMELDRWLHFGQHPWEILHPVMGYAPVTYAITGFYHIWFMVMWIVLVALAFARMASHLRLQFFSAFMLTWGVGGSVLAILFSSAGPCYYSRLGLSPDPFLPLMDYLHGLHAMHPLWAINTQEMLWQGYLGNGLRLGISAFPSMHNAASLLFALVCYRLNRKLGITLFVFTALIFLGSIHLGWHYAVDGYAGFAIALSAWWLSGLMIRSWEKSRWARDYREAVAQSDRANTRQHG